MRTTTRLCAAILWIATGVSLAHAEQAAAPALSKISTHDNQRPAGTLANGELRLSLWAGIGRWSPFGAAGSTLDLAAVGEQGGPLTVPSPLIRVPQGTVVHISLRNTLTIPLRVTGFCDRPGRCDALVIAPGATGDARFTLNAAGTFHYWGGRTGSQLGNREGDDSQLGGAIIADPPSANTSDRVFVLGRRASEAGSPRAPLTVINGRSWPYTERLSYATGDTVRWRVINLTNIAHAMHLHGFYFRVDSVGDGAADTHYEEPQRREAVTEQVGSGRTMMMNWMPQRPGNWLFHCHMLVHMMARESLRPGLTAEAGAHTGAPHDSAGMAGLVLGVLVTGPDRTPAAPAAVRRALQMVVERDTRLGAAASYRVGLTSAGATAPRLNQGAVPGPVMVLTRGQPVSVEVVNRMQEPTAIHWHGIELESYDDGVPGFGGTAGSVTPPVMPGGTFTARFTPMRAGTFIYHTHWHDPAQLAGGIYGPILVLEPGEAYEPSRDHVILLSLDGAYPEDALRDEPFAVNGARHPPPLQLKPGVVNRLRFINITADAVALTVQLISRFDPVQWTLVGKDGAAAPPAQRTGRQARQLITVGETYDFDVTPGPGPLWLELRRGNGEQLIQWAVLVGR